MNYLMKLSSTLVGNDHVRRIFHAFWQAAGGLLLSSLLLVHSSQDVKMAFGAAASAGLAAVKALIIARQA